MSGREHIRHIAEAIAGIQADLEADPVLRDQVEHVRAKLETDRGAPVTTSEALQVLALAGSRWLWQKGRTA